jgi:crossover junction endodeoxyribonuclease RuvC
MGWHGVQAEKEEEKSTVKRFVGIDPSTKLGLVVLDAAGRLLDAVEIAPKGQDPDRMIELIDRTIARLDHGDHIAIEGFGFASQQAIQLGGIGWGLRMALRRKRMRYIEPTPNQVKKFSTDKGNADKNVIMREVYKRWGFEHDSDNVIDAFVLAQIAMAYYLPDVELTSFQREVIEAIKNPPVKKSKKKAN